MRGAWPRLFKLVVFVACCIQPARLAYALCQILLWDQPDALGPDPATEIIHRTGRSALILLLVTLSITPARRLFKLNRLQSVRRMLGVWTFAYACLHVAAYLVFKQNCYAWATCEFGDIWKDLTARPFIFVGMFAFTILLLLAITSTNGWMRRLKKRWQTLHRLVYVAAIAAVVHFAWGQKSDITEPLRWGAYLTLLLGVRVYFAVRKRASSQVHQARSAS